MGRGRRRSPATKVSLFCVSDTAHSVTSYCILSLAYTSYGVNPSSGGLAKLDACPNSAGPYHADPDAQMCDIVIVWTTD